MKANNFFLLKLLVVVLVLTYSSASFSQCQGGYKQCVKFLENEYKSNGQNNSAVISPGEAAKMNMVFYKGYDYRIVFCAEEQLGQLAIKVYTTKGELLFDNAQHENAFHWDFTMKATQRLVIDVSAPTAEDAEDGCVTIALGLRNSVKKGF